MSFVHKHHSTKKERKKKGEIVNIDNNQLLFISEKRQCSLVGSSMIY